MTAAVLLKMIQKWSQSYKLPLIFYLQLDNCVKENKNQYVMWLFAPLVELLVFDKVSPVSTNNFFSGGLRKVGAYNIIPRGIIALV